MTIRLAIVDDHPIYREGLVHTLGRAAEIEIVGEAGDADEAVALAIAVRPDLILLDISMPGSGIEALRRIVALPDPPAVAMLTVSEDDDDILQCLKAGAKGYILKGIGARELVSVVGDIAAGRSYVSPSLAVRILQAMQSKGTERKARTPIDDLSKREEDVLRLVARGLSNREAGEVLGLQEKTVKHYMTIILQKLHVRNRTEAAMLLRETSGPSED